MICWGWEIRINSGVRQGHGTALELPGLGQLVLVTDEDFCLSSPEGTFPSQQGFSGSLLQGTLRGYETSTSKRFLCQAPVLSIISPAPLWGQRRGHQGCASARGNWCVPVQALPQRPHVPVPKRVGAQVGILAVLELSLDELVQGFLEQGLVLGVHVLNALQPAGEKLIRRISRGTAGLSTPEFGTEKLSSSSLLLFSVQSGPEATALSMKP